MIWNILGIVILFYALLFLLMWVGAKIFWKEGFKELDNVLGTKFINYKKEEKNDNKETK